MFILKKTVYLLAIIIICLYMPLALIASRCSCGRRVAARGSSVSSGGYRGGPLWTGVHTKNNTYNNDLRNCPVCGLYVGVGMFYAIHWISGLRRRLYDLRCSHPFDYHPLSRLAIYILVLLTTWIAWAIFHSYWGIIIAVVTALFIRYGYELQCNNQC